MRTDRLLLAALAALAPGLVAAQAPAWPTQQDIERALKGRSFPQQERIGAQPTPQVPRIDPKRAGADVESLARAHMQRPESQPAAGGSPAPVRIFVTLDMPRASLELLTDQAARTGAEIVLRGLKAQSMRETLRAVGDLIGTRTIAWVIDPEAFTRYGIDHAPTFVLALGNATQPQACSDGCAAPAAFVSVAGDVSLDHALEAMLRRRPDAAPVAEPLLIRLRTP